MRVAIGISGGGWSSRVGSGRTLAAILFVLAAARSGAFQSISPAEAIDHVGERATVCGVVASAKFAETSKGAPTFLNLDRPYPSHVFTVVIWEEHRAKFSKPPESFTGRRVCVTGAIELYRGRAEIRVSEPSQLRMDGAP